MVWTFHKLYITTTAKTKPLASCDNLWKLYAFSVTTSLVTPQLYDNAPSNCASPLKNLIKEYTQNYNMGHYQP